MSGPRPAVGLVALAAVVSALVVTHVDTPAARIVPALLLVFVLPGYALSAALLPKGGLAWERIPLTLGLSIAITALGSLAAYKASARLEVRLWANFLAGATLVACTVAVVRARDGAAEGARFSFRRISPLGLLAAVAVAFVVVDAVFLARSPVDTQVQGYSSIWITRPGKAPNAALVGVTSSERRRTNYRLRVVSRARVLFQHRLELAPGQTWRILVPDTGRVPLRAELYKDGAQRPSVRVRLTS
jgi:uncharacterized membrane protein